MIKNHNVKNIFLNSRAFTLVETLIVIAIAVAMFFVLIQFYIGFNSSLSNVNATMDVSGTAGTVVAEIASVVRVATSVVASRAFGGTTYESDADSLVLELPSLDESGNIIASTYDYVVFYKSGNSIYKIMDANGASVRDSGQKLLSETAQTLSFAYNPSTLSSTQEIEVDITTQKTVRGTVVQSHLRQQTFLRNK